MVLARRSEHVLPGTKNQDVDTKHRFAHKNTQVLGWGNNFSCGRGRCALTYGFSRSLQLRALSTDCGARHENCEGTLLTSLRPSTFWNIVDYSWCGQVLDQTHAKLIREKFDGTCQKLGLDLTTLSKERE